MCVTTAQKSGKLRHMALASWHNTVETTTALSVQVLCSAVRVVPAASQPTHPILFFNSFWILLPLPHLEHKLRRTRSHRDGNESEVESKHVPPLKGFWG